MVKPMHKRQSDSRNLSMIMDFYEMTMSNGYFNANLQDQVAVFDLFFRTNPDEAGFSIFAGLQQIVDYVLNLHFDDEDIDYLRSQHCFSDSFLEYLRSFRFKGDIYAVAEGTVIYPNEPVITVVAPLIDAQLVETMMLLIMNHQTLIATKANRIVRAAQGRAVSDFGARRAHNGDAAVYGARAAYIGGVNSTATVLAGQMFDIPVSGTMAHSWVMVFEDEFAAFRQYALTYPDNTVLLVDTYDVLHSGVPNAIRVAKEVLEPMGKRLKGIRLDSGDLAYLSKKCRKMLDAAGLEDCMIVVSNSLDEFSIESLFNQGARIDAFGVGERLITSKSHPVFGGVYKNVAIVKDGVMIPKIKISENVEKITNPGFKQVWRIYDEFGKAVADMLSLHEETVDLSKPYPYMDPKKPWKHRVFENCTGKPLLSKVIEKGELVKPLPTLDQIRYYVRHQLDHEIWDEEQRFVNPHLHYLDMSQTMYDLKMKLLSESRHHGS